MESPSPVNRGPQKDRKNILITGGNSGIGLETARGLYGDGHYLIIASRN